MPPDSGSIFIARVFDVMVAAVAWPACCARRFACTEFEILSPLFNFC